MKKAGADMGFPIPDVAVDGEVIEADPPRRLVQTLADAAWTRELAAEGFTRLTYEIAESRRGRLQAHRDPRPRGRAAARRWSSAASWRSEGAGGGWSGCSAT